MEIEIRSVVLRGREQRSVKKLGGFEKHHTVPQRTDAYHNGWVGKIAADDLEQEINGLVALLRSHAGMKRRDFEAHIEGAGGVVRTSQFEYTVTVALTEDDPSQVWWTRELSPLENLSYLVSPALADVFRDQLYEIDVQFVQHADISQLIDAFEDKGMDVEYPFDSTSCTLTISDFGVVEVKPEGFVLRYPDAREPAWLIEKLETFFETGLRRAGINCPPLG